MQGAVLVFHDVSEQQLIVKKLTKSEALYKATFDHASIGIAHIATNGQFLKVNKFFTDFTHINEVNLQNYKFQNNTHPKDLNKALAFLNN